MKVLISGASIAGPALAHWMADRHDVTVVERAAAMRPGGYAVDIRGAALKVVERMGLMEEVRARQTDTEWNEVVDERGRRFGRTGRGFGVIDKGDIEILRGDLAALLYEQTKSRAEYRFGDHVLAIDQPASPRGDAARSAGLPPEGVDVAFASGRCERYDLVVGADGVHSRTRQLVFGPGGEEPLAGTAMAIFTAPDLLGLGRGQLLHSGVGRVASMKGCDGNVVVCLFFPVGESLSRETVAAELRGMGWEWPRFADAVLVAPDYYADETCQVRGRLVHDRVALVGDAGYCPSPLSGQGTSLALVGAYMLAHAPSLAAYEAAMLPFARANQDVAISIARGFSPASPWQVRMRNWMMRLLPYMPWAPLVMKIAMRGVRKAANAIELPELEPLEVREPPAERGGRRDAVNHQLLQASE